MQARARRRSRSRRAPAGRPARTGGCRGRSPTRERRDAPATHRVDPAQVGGLGHLDVGRVAGDDMDRDSTGLQERGLVGPRLGAVRRELLVGTRAGGRARTPCGVCAVTRSERSTVAATSVAADPLDGLGDRHDRDRRAVAFGRRAPPPRPARRTTSGRAPSWTRTTRSPIDPASAPARAPRTRPRPTVLATVAAGDDLDRRRSGSQRPPAIASTSVGRRRPRRSASTTGDAASASSVQASSGRPAIGASSLSIPLHPPRRPGGDDDRRRPAASARRPLNRDAAGRRSSGRPRSAGRA